MKLVRAVGPLITMAAASYALAACKQYTPVSYSDMHVSDSRRRGSSSSKLTSAGVSKVPSHRRVVRLGSRISAAHFPQGLCMHCYTQSDRHASSATERHDCNQQAPCNSKSPNATPHADHNQQIPCSRATPNATPHAAGRHHRLSMKWTGMSASGNSQAGWTSLVSKHANAATQQSTAQET